ncbi:MAG TPA: murein L,D-transpeptidase catalytic domain family protein [Puia sp.]|nr:murein L,D-transpeptidase catalytic domain family protein [Puia sp.]
MRTLTNPLFICATLLLLSIAPASQAGSVKKTKARTHRASSAHCTAAKKFSADFEEEVATLYEEIDLNDFGLSKEAFEYAYKGYLYLLEHHRLNRTNVLSICDFSQSSRSKRLYIIDLDQKKVLINTFVAHGRNSGAEFAHSFSNSNRSHKSSLGFYITENTYFGDHGLSLKIQGVERGFNDKAARRNIVIHGSKYVGEDFLEGNPISGRSFGCPAVPFTQIDEVVDAIKEGSCLFIYHPTKKYLLKSKIINS